MIQVLFYNSESQRKITSEASLQAHAWTVQTATCTLANAYECIHTLARWSAALKAETQFWSDRLPEEVEPGWEVMSNSLILSECESSQRKGVCCRHEQTHVFILTWRGCEVGVVFTETMCLWFLRPLEDMFWDKLHLLTIGQDMARAKSIDPLHTLFV